MKTITIFIVSYVLSLQVFGANIFPDTTHPRKPWKISKQEFLDRYGRYDTSRALIKYFLTSRKGGQIIAITGAALTTGLGFYFDRVIVNGNGSGSSPGGLIGFFLGIPLASAIWGIGIATLFGLYLWIAYSRKKLWRILNNYFPGKGIPFQFKKVFYKRISLLRKK